MTNPDFQMYPDEVTKVSEALTKLSNAFDFTHHSEANRALFNTAVAEEFGKIGLLARVNWHEVHAQGQPTGVWIPGVEPYGRTRQEAEHDHDREKFGIVRGLDGKEPGYIREDGTKREDPRSKDIF